MATVKEVIKILGEFDPDAYILLGSLDLIYYENISVGSFDESDEFCIIRPASPYTSIKREIIEAGWRPKK